MRGRCGQIRRISGDNRARPPSPDSFLWSEIFFAVSRSVDSACESLLKRRVSGVPKEGIKKQYSIGLGGVCPLLERDSMVRGFEGRSWPTSQAIGQGRKRAGRGLEEGCKF